ncbi:MM3350-like domain-containing protein [Sparassis latifolia]|uniref:MYND-type domain-containing protein n=1 Tax=Sparassis crispa TaxID=139825 RepID=A0A401H5B2_9APHY|nr:hypothetical protein SCP_1602670 [Sparassis crispa]GBE89604.1 hypothetical protein SCP_1602670 [Sparassis crispa]
MLTSNSALKDFTDDFGGGNLPPPPYGGRPKYVKFGPGDKGEGLSHAFFEDPRIYKGTPGSRGQIHSWGLYPYDEDNLPIYDVSGESLFRQMKYQVLYMGTRQSPQQQFIDVLMDRKRKEIAALDLNGLDKQDVILHVKFTNVNSKNGEPRIWRRFRLSGGIKLSVFQDKVLAPILGWVRNFHCYVFTDLRDGALFGPETSSSVDRVHLTHIGYDYLPDEKFMLSHLFAKEGDQIGYLYDFGDKWFHEITVEKIIPQEESDGEVKILDGKGMCPGENMNGCHSFGPFLEEYDKATPARKVEMKREILACPNYNAFGKPPSLFDPDSFSLPEAAKRLADALGSANSVRSGAKVFNMPIAPDGVADAFKRMHLKKGQHIMKDYDPEGLGYWEETTSSRKDKRDETVCAACGKPSPEELKVCGGCHQVRYCCPEHQKTHWKAVHKNQCSRKYMKK